MSPISATFARQSIHRMGMVLALSGLLAACGGGGGAAPADVPRFERINVSGTDAVRDNVTGVVWAGRLGSAGLPAGASEPAAAELLQLTDLGASTLRPFFAFVLDTPSPLIKAQDAVNGASGLVWAVDFGVAGDPGGLGVQATPLKTDPAPEVSDWYVLSRRSAVPSVSYPAAPASNGTVSAAGLTWKVCSEGSSWTGSTCIGTASNVAAAGAQALADAANAARFAGFSDWRVPTQQELRALLQLQNDVGSGNLLPAAFAVDRLDAIAQYWSSSRSSSPDFGWVVGFSGFTSGDIGGIALTPLTGLASVRLVRTAP